MKIELTHKDFPWKRSRSGFAVFVFFSLLVGLSLLRIVLFLRFGLHEKASIGTDLEIFLVGFQQDFLVALLATLPLLFWLWIIPDTAFGRLLHRIFFIACVYLFWVATVFLFFTEYYFFEEFKSRFNTVSVDYLMYPSEVFVNIRDSYPVGVVLAVCAVAGLVWCIAAFGYFRQMWHQPTSTVLRVFHLIVAVVLCFVLWLTLNPNAELFPSFDIDSIYSWMTSHTQGTHFSDDRTLNEIANNGELAFMNAAMTRDLDYSAYYQTISIEEAYARARRMVAEPGATLSTNAMSIVRHVAGDAAKPKLNVVILLEESLGSEFWGSLGRTNTLTPEMDKLAATEGMFFTNIYASGNRTVRGFEGVLSSFPPLPGDSIVKRDRSDNVETIARILKRDGYSSVFLYGGRGLFDSMRPYTMRNGWDRFIEQKDFPKANYNDYTKTIWGACDEMVFARAIEEFRALNNAGKPFLGTVMSVSNHKPYTYPRGRITDDPDKPKRTQEKAVEYADWCLGHFFDLAKQEAFWTNTIFVVVADHGARVYGSQSIPIHSYEIPLVILGPAVVKEPVRIGQLGCSLDVSPTILGLIGRPYDTMFFGHNLLKEQPGDGRVFINHNRDIGLMARDRLVVLSMFKTEEFYAGNPKVVDMQPLPQPGAVEGELQKDAIAAYQVADDLYMHRLYRLDGLPRTNAPAPAVAEPAK